MECQFSTLEYQAVMAKDKATEITIDWVNGTTSVGTGAEIYELIWNSNEKMVLSANGTILTLEKEGIIPTLLRDWYFDRKRLQKNKTLAQALATGIQLPDNFLDELKDA